VVDVLSEEVVQGGFVEPGVPAGGDGAVRVAGVGDDEAVVLFAFGGFSGTCGVGNYVHPHCFGDSSDLARLVFLLDVVKAEEPSSPCRPILP